MSQTIDIGTPLIARDQIERRVREMAHDINRDYAGTGRPLTVVVVLKGACFFAVDLLKHVSLVVHLDFLEASSYRGTASTGEVRLIKDITLPIAAGDVLLIEDIVDTGLTASWLKLHLASHNPASVRLCALLDKPSGRRVHVEIDYTGFVIPDAFVLGYGLDFDEAYRNLPAIHVAKPRW